ncbi:LysR family transcriptional regulator [Shewanella sp. D64]|uniref:LysR family transcriptional regulator n=1 Tax=unclassified Shewanella TaxID=196818 RepID=UPI0022BA26C7|nr:MULTISPECIES: LysR family transcriptional regulator [unclassified Shewanella]MEC4726297.1 LysR family transcriptional regulator [Shewanella sp. D64]MEC4738309.1 LysR family transcriptional regulator [Shewanella sp. E94]WBJ95444.1 LysR family transcriptional regulator [Shewanella sp. MTB7]
MDIKFFQTFLEVVKTRHFGRAGEKLYISQSTVSSRIKILESYYDTKLLTRDRNNISLTSTGERLVGYAELITNTSIRSKLELSLTSGVDLQIKLAGTPNVWDAYLNDFLSYATKNFEKHSFIADFQSRDQIRENLLNNTLDLAFTLEPVIAAGVSSTKVSKINIGLVHTVNWKEDSLCRYIYVDWGPQFAVAQSSLLGGPVIPCLRTSSSNIALNYMIKNRGGAYLPLKSVQNLISSGQLVQSLAAGIWEQSIYLNYMNNDVPPDVSSFIENIMYQLDSCE